MRDVLVIGGGLAGAALATHLSEAGVDVRLVEREVGPRDKVCGDVFHRGPRDVPERALERAHAGRRADAAAA